MEKDNSLKVAKRLAMANALLEAIKTDVAGFQPDDFESVTAITGVQELLDDTRLLFM